MHLEPQWNQTVFYIALNVISAAVLAAADSNLSVLLGLTNWAYHFMHYFFTFLFLCLYYSCSLTLAQTLPIMEMLPITLTQVIISVTTCVIHSGSVRAVYLLRLTDFATSIVTIFIAKKFVDKSCVPANRKKVLLIFIAIGSSLSWLEMSIFDFDVISWLMTPILVVASALHCLITFQKQQQLQVHTDQLTRYITGSMAACLFLPALFFTSDSFNKNMLGITHSWLIHEYICVMIAVVFSFGLIYSEYWMMVSLTPESYMVVRHSKYTLASVGRWFFLPLAQIPVFGCILGKVMAVSGIGYYIYNRYSKQKLHQEDGGAENLIVTY